MSLGVTEKCKDLLASHNYKLCYIDTWLAGRFIMCSTHSRTLLPAYLLFPIHDVQEPERLHYQKGGEAASSISSYPENF